jgi:hypothetical protein
MHKLENMMLLIDLELGLHFLFQVVGMLVLDVSMLLLGTLNLVNLILLKKKIIFYLY